MKNSSFKAFRVHKEGDLFKGAVKEIDFSSLPVEDVTIRVAYSSLNYKDALSSIGHPGVSKIFPHTPGVDAAGLVTQSKDPRFKEGDQVLVTGYDLGMNTPGGFSEYVRVPGDWIVPLPKGLDLRESMILGTAGFTAGLCVTALLHNGLKSEDGPVVVTGASGGVGCLSIVLLSKLGFDVVAGTGKREAQDILKRCGAKAFLSREELAKSSNRPLLPPKWAGAIDNVGGSTLENILKSLKPYGSVASVGLVDKPDYESFVYPFILRSNNILGVASANTPMDRRLKIWEKLAGPWKLEGLNKLTSETSLIQLDEHIKKMLDGNTMGRILITMG